MNEQKLRREIYKRTMMHEYNEVTGQRSTAIRGTVKAMESRSLTSASAWSPACI